MTNSDPWLDELSAETTERLSRIAQLQADLCEVYGEASTAHGLVHVRVNAAGRPTSLRLEPTAMSMPAPDLAAAVLEAVSEAAAAAGARLAALVRDLVPPSQLDAMLTGQPTEADRLAVREWSAGTAG